MLRSPARRLDVVSAIGLLAWALLPCAILPAKAASPTGLGIEFFLENGQKSSLGTGLSGMAETVLSEISTSRSTRIARSSRLR